MPTELFLGVTLGNFLGFFLGAENNFGFYATFDRGNNWDHVNTAAIGQFYHVAISPKQPYWVFGGLQDNGSWGGPAISKNGGTLNEDWISLITWIYRQNTRRTMAGPSWGRRRMRSLHKQSLRAWQEQEQEKRRAAGFKSEPKSAFVGSRGEVLLTASKPC